MNATRYHVQPMTGKVHLDPKCTLGTARYGTTPCTLSDAETEANLASGRMSACKRCVGA